MRRTTARRLAVPIALLAAWVAGSTLGAAPATRHARAMPFLQIEAAHATHVPALDGSEPIFLLVIGSDARPGEDVARTRADSIHLVGVNPAKGKATIVGFPRDSYVPIPGFGTNKINAAMVNGGPPLVVQTVEELTGVTIDYWALTWFEGFEAMVNDVGGLSMNVPFDVYDTYAHAQIEAGQQVLNGHSALAFARARHALPQGDFGRSENQGRLMAAALAQFRREFTKDPGRLLIWIAALLKNAQTEIPLDELMTLAFTGTTLNPKRVVNIVIPGNVGMAGGTSIVTLDQTALEAISRDIANDGLVSAKNAPPSPNEELLPSADTESEAESE
jgi:polyisoprenyl-teichoic acid--peptidoglycan teichoic acid transferase